MYDTVVIGAGPVGNTAARLCAEKGLSALVIEEHPAIGHPVQCAGLLSNAAFAACEVSMKPVNRTVSGAKIYPENGDPLSFDAGCTKAYVVDRTALDAETAARAADAGADYAVKTCVTRVDENKKLIHTADGKEIPYRILIAADGPRSVAARSFGVAPSKFMYAGIQAEVPYAIETPQVELYPNAAPDFFAWAIPVTDTVSRIGLCSTKQVPELFEAFKKRFLPSTLHFVTGTIPVGVREKICGPSWMLAGDAAGFPKPTSGGGVYTGIRSAHHAAETAVEALDSGDTSSYAKRCRDDFGRELDIGMQFLKFRRSLSKEDVDRILSTLNTPDIIRIISEYGDIDKPSLLFKQLIKRPELLSLGWTGVKGLMRMIAGAK
ncbi:MAG TPA: NAD(P)/FAD-dependent oxidoreductase [Methanocorpusculum sp.]|nr:NAD(P)/FAD-dependent oxidoreductase [Methanocorpusculum sp.]